MYNPSCYLPKPICLQRHHAFASLDSSTDLYSHNIQQRRKSGPASKPHVGIVGAGLSGLRCADILLQHGFQVTIIEGRNRIGGRLYQQKLANGQLVDMGPNWIHGSDDNPMLDLAKQTGTALESWDVSSYVFNESGDLLPVQEAEAYAILVWDIIQDAFVYSNKSFAEIDERLSLFDFFKQKVVEKIPDSEDDFQKKRETVLQMSETWGTYIGSPVSRQSLKFFWLEECIEGGKSTLPVYTVLEHNTWYNGVLMPYEITTSEPLLRRHLSKDPTRDCQAGIGWSNDPI